MLITVESNSTEEAEDNGKLFLMMGDVQYQNEEILPNVT